ncbi:hypothetical protein [Geobacillus sp. Y412MC52]|uniref:hypothetical protein n=1 Tax=Geobacillus sp. (strain Y412MC52) TaxID=550542 RepID=UPI001E350BCE|nr:hypothetical protein [Geobacillus sp. Y412MC52]
MERLRMRQMDGLIVCSHEVEMIRWPKCWALQLWHSPILRSGKERSAFFTIGWRQAVWRENRKSCLPGCWCGIRHNKAWLSVSDNQLKAK